MRGRVITIAPLPDSFDTEEEAGEFWDSHSTMDYEEYLEPAGDTIELAHRVFEVPIEEDVFRRLQEEAKSANQPVRAFLDHTLRKTLAVTGG